MGPDTSRRLFPLTSCSIGLWSPVEGMRPFLLLCPDRKQFVVLLSRDPETKAHDSSAGSLSVNAVLACARNYAALWLRHKNPFIDHTQEPSGDTAVLTFEVAFSDVVGMDFRWPLTVEPRLVLEASCLCKRVFNSVDDVCAHYPPVRQRRLRGTALGAPPAAAPAAGTSGAGGDQPLQQLLEPKQHQQQQGSDAASTAGIMSRVPSWASWASWTIGSARNSLDVFAVPTPAGNGAAAAGAGAGAAAAAGPLATTVAAASGYAAPGQAGGSSTHAAMPGDADNAAQPSAGGLVLTALSDNKQQQQAVGSKTLIGQRNDSGSSGNSSRGPGCTLDSMVSLSGGMAGAPARAAAAAGAVAAADAGAGTDADECCSQPQATQLQVQDGWAWGRGGRAGKSNSDPGASAAATTAAVVGALAPQQECSRQHTPGISPAVSGTSTPLGASGGALSDSGLSEHAALLQGALAEASFGFWQQRPGHQDDTLAGLGQHRLQVNPGRPRSARHGAATAPCSMPNSPRQDAMFAQGSSSPLASSETAGGVRGQTLTKFDQQLQQEQQQQQCQHRSRAAGRSSLVGSRRSSRSRLAAAAAESSCPLCHQTLTQPHAILQQRFHQQTEQKLVRMAAAGHAPGRGGKCVPVPRSQSACSLQQLQQLQQQERVGSDGGSDSPAVPSLNLQQQQQGMSDEHGQQGPLSPRSFAGPAAAAIGVLAARCKPISSNGAQRLLRLQRADTGASEVGTPDSASVAAAGSSGEDGADTDSAGAAGSMQQRMQATAEPAASSSSCRAAGAPGDGPTTRSCQGGTAADPNSIQAAPAAAAAPAGASNTAAGDAPAGSASPVLPSGADASARVSLGDKVSAPSAAPAPAGTAGVGADTVAATAAGLAGAAANAVATVAAASAAAAAGKEGMSSSRQVMYSNRTVVLTFTDPTLPYQLSKLVKNPSNVHLLKLYESGLPAWAVVLPSYGLWYRPWLRRVTWLLFVLLSVVSMAMGFYDLWKNVPYFKQVVVGMFRPAATVFEWLEGHTQIRLSILLTYMVGKSQLLVQLVKLLTDASLQPLLAPFAPLATFASALFQGVAWLLQPIVELVRFVFGPIGRLVWVLLQLLWRLVSTLLWFGPLQLLQLIGSVVMGIGQVLLLPFEAVLPAAASLRAGWGAAKATGQVARNAAPVVAEAARTAAGAGTWWWWSPFEALELMRVSTVRVVKALQAVLRFFVTLASAINKHRLSLMMQLKGKVWGGLQAAAASPAGRVATVVAHRMGQGDRLRRVQQNVARQLHAQDSLNSMGSEALASMGPFSPAAADGYAYRPYSRTFSLDGESDMLLETQERLDSEDDDAGEVSSSSMRWQQQQQGDRSSLQQQAPGRPFRSSAGLRQRAVTAAAAAAAAAAGEGMGMHHVGLMHSNVLSQGSDFQQQQVLGGGLGLGARASFSSRLDAAGVHDVAFLTRQQQQQQVLGPDLFAEAGLGRHTFGSSSSGNGSIQDPVLAAAAARAALSRSYHLPTGSFNSSSAAAAATVSTADLQRLRVRQSCESLSTGSAAAAAAAAAVPTGAGPGVNPFEWASAGGALGVGGSVERGPGRLQHAVQGQHSSSSGALSCSGVALVTEAAGLLMMPQKGRQQQLH